MSRGTGRRSLYTIGHSTRSVAELTDILRAFAVTRLVDIRSLPRSWTNPQFNVDVLSEALRGAGIAYVHLAALGGLRARSKRVDEGVNAGWERRPFRNYADYAETAPFREGLRELLEMASRETSAIMCAETLWWRCHRRIVTDHLLAHGVLVVHLFTRTKAELASLTPFAVVGADASVYYPAPTPTSAERGPSVASRAAMVQSESPAFNVGDHVSWSSEAGRVRGVIQKKLTVPTKFKTYTVRASLEEPQYLIESDKTDHLAVHKGAALRRLRTPAPAKFRRGPSRPG